MNSTLPPSTETFNRLAALILGYRDNKPALTAEALRRQSYEPCPICHRLDRDCLCAAGDESEEGHGGL